MKHELKHAYETALVMADALNDDDRLLTALMFLQAFVRQVGEDELTHGERRRLAEVVHGHLLEHAPGEIDQRIACLAIEVLGETLHWPSRERERRTTTEFITRLDMRTKGMSEQVGQMWKGIYGR